VLTTHYLLRMTHSTPYRAVLTYCFSLFTTHYSLTHYLLLATYHVLLTTCYSPRATYHMLLTACYLPHATYHMHLPHALTTCYLVGLLATYYVRIFLLQGHEDLRQDERVMQVRRAGSEPTHGIRTHERDPNPRTGSEPTHLNPPQLEPHPAGCCSGLRALVR
jgi:hypothetical protein